MLRSKLPVRMLLFVVLAGCASTSRSCSSGCAETFGADWVVVQMDNDGRPYRCWDLHEVSITSEHGDGVYWKDVSTNNLIHISGHFNRVQVIGNDWGHAYATLGLTKETCAAVRGQTYDPGARTFTSAHTGD